MKKRKVFFGVRAALLAAFAVRAGGLVMAQTGSGPVVYAAGYEGSFDEWGMLQSTAMVWEISGSRVTPLVLTGEAHSAEVHGLAESGGSLYAAGDESSGSNRIAVVWKIDGSTVTPIPLSDGTRNVYARGITESGGSLYAAGYEEESYARSTAMVWKIDGSAVTAIPLTRGEAWGITAAGDSLYVAGYERNNSLGTNAARVWKVDGSSVRAIALTDSWADSRVWSIVESGGSVYAAGYENNSRGNSVARVWRINGASVNYAMIVLTDGTRNGNVRGITAAGGGGTPILYAAGDEGNYSSSAAMVWTYGSGVTPPIVLAASGEAQAITAGGGGDSPSLYAAGSEKNSGGTTVARVWKIDGSKVTAIPLTDGKRRSIAYAVIVHRE